MASGSATDGEAPHLVLVGLPGAGKTTVGRAVAERLQRPFLDFDEEIERRERRTIAEIFAGSGEPYFRALERALTRELSERRGMVLSPGGGWIADAESVALLRPPARIIYLRVEVQTALRRLGAEARRRPLLEGREEPAMRELLASRARSYESADVVIDTEVIDLQQVIREVERLAAP